MRAFGSTADVWTGVSLFALAVAGWFVLIPLGIDLPNNINVAALSPDFWPRIVMIILAVSGASVALQGLFGRPVSDTTSSDDDGLLVAYPPRKRLLRVLIALGLIFAFYAAIPYLGVVAGSVLLILSFTLLLGQRSWWRVLALAVLLPVLLYLFFAHVAHVPMPLGWFEAYR